MTNRGRAGNGAGVATPDGIIVVSKPAGPTSHDMVALVRRLSGVRRVGHGGTLDPFAAGVLPLFLGTATRLVEYHLADEKAYRALVCFGARSTTDDLDGELTPGGGPPTRDAVEAGLAGFRGTITQIPPDYSAVRVAGRHAYELARHGQKPELRPRTVDIRQLELVEWHEDAERPTATLELRCSAGTYVRSLARDLGEVLGTGAYLVALTRTASGPFPLDRAHTAEAVRAALTGGRASDVLLPPDTGLEEFPRLKLSAEDLSAVARGQIIRLRTPTAVTLGPGGLLRILDQGGRLAAIARLDSGRLHPEKVFLPPATRPS